MSVQGTSANCLTRTLLVANFLVFAGAFPALAKDVDYFDLPPEQLLDAEVVSVSRRTEKVSQTAAAVYVITNEDIIRSGVTNIPDALRMAPGVEVAQADSNTWAVSIRGFNDDLARRLLVMIDGRTVYNTLHGGVYWEAHNLVLEDIERIEVIRGPGGAVWGANAVNGVINIIRKHTRATQGTMVSGIVGTHERAGATVRQGGQISEDGPTYRLYGKYFAREEYQRPDGADNHGDWDGYRTGFRVDWDDALTISGDLYSTDSEQYAQSFSLTAPYTIATPETVNSSGANLTVRWSHFFENSSVLDVRSFLDFTEREETLLSDDRMIFDTEVQYSLRPLARHAIIVGGGWRYIADELSGSDLVTFDPDSREDSIFSAFVQDKITLLPDSWFLTLGSKFEHNFYTGFEYQPTARTQWFPDETQTVWAAVSRAIRMPARIERDLDITNVILDPSFLGQPARLTLAHNEGLDSEKLIAYEFGYRKQFFPNLSADLATFYNEYNNLYSLEAGTTTAVVGPPAFLDIPLVYVNGEEAETFGGELVIDWKVSQNWNLTATYSYVEIESHSPNVLGFSQETEEEITPLQHASLQSSWNIDETWLFDSKLYYVDEVPRYNIDSYVRLDLNLGWQISDNVRLNLVGQNLLENSHREFNAANNVNAAEIERSVFGKFTWEF